MSSFDYVVAHFMQKLAVFEPMFDLVLRMVNLLFLHQMIVSQ